MKSLFAVVAVAIATLPTAVDARVWDVSVGAKGTVGGNIWTESSNAPNTEIGFTKLRGGVGAGF